MSNQPIVKGEATELTQNDYARTGYTFDGWNTAGDGSGTGYEDQDQITITEETTLYAQWKLETYSITYELNSGNITGEKTSYTVNDENFTLVTPSRNGFQFTGWTGTGLSSASTSVTITKGSTGNRTYTANWAQLYTWDYYAYSTNTTWSYNLVNNGSTYSFYLTRLYNTYTFSSGLTNYNTTTGKWTVDYQGTIDNIGSDYIGLCIFVKTDYTGVPSVINR